MKREDAQQAQDDEKLVIESIFGDEAEFEKAIWKVWRPLHVTIHLEPLSSDSRSPDATAFVSVDLEVVCSDMYPSVIPTISLKNSKGLSQDDLKILSERLHSKKIQSLGNPMILDLCEEVRQFLYEKNEPPKGSFHDGMLKKQAMEQSEMKRQRANSEKREIEKVAEEKERKEVEVRWRKEGEMEMIRQGKMSNFDKEGETRVIGGRSVVVLSNVPSKRKRTNQYCTEWMAFYDNEQVLISEWSFQFTLGRKPSKKQSIDFTDFLKSVDDFESTIQHLAVGSTPVDATLVSYAFIHVDRISTTNSNLNVVVYVAQRVLPDEEHIPNIQEIIAHDPPLLRRLAAQSICALRWLHDQQLAHGSLTINSVWSSQSSFRVSDFVTIKHLTSMCERFQEAVGDKQLSVLIAEERSPRRKDLFNLGVMLDGLASKNPSRSESSEYHSHLSEFIKACQTAKNIDELVDHRYLVQDLLTDSGDSAAVTRLDPDSRSRLANEFFVIKWLGKGGFGDVLLARNKLDSNDYAVKRIPLNPKSEKLNRRITREAKLFSKLNHPHVVRYFSAWIEDAARPKGKDGRTLSSDKVFTKAAEKSVAAGDSLLPSRIRNVEAAACKGRTSRTETSEWSASYRVDDKSSSSSDTDSEEGNQVQHLFSPKSNRSDDFEILFEASGGPVTTDSITDPSQSTMESSLPATTETATDTPIEPTPASAPTEQTEDTNEPPTRLLYIQMEYCEKATLRALIDSTQLIGNSKLIWRIFGEMLLGLQYIHRQGMIHRDIKPLNILLDGNDHVKIGDFGLATRDFLLKKDSTVATASADFKPTSSGQTRDIGTELYMAPELFVLDDSKPYTSKIDVYSTGIVLFEMFYRPLPPGMERISTIRHLKTVHQLPADFGTSFSSMQGSLAKKLVEWMLAENADDRPSIEELLSDDHLPLADLDDDHFQKVFTKTLKKRSGRLYNWMMESLAKDEPPAALTFCYDQDICGEKNASARDSCLEEISHELVSLLRIHSFEPISSHLLVPSTTAKRVLDARSKPAQLFDVSGFSVALPTDLRQNFVRYCARNAVNRLKRYSIGRVFSSGDAIGGVHPLERYECSIDSIGPATVSVTLTSEILIAVTEISAKLLSDFKATLRIGHVSLIYSAMRHLTIPDESRKIILQGLHNIATCGKRLNLSEKIDVLAESVGFRVANSLLCILPSDSSIALFKESCKTLTRSRDESARDMARQALFELETITGLVYTGIDESSRPYLCLDASLCYRPATFSDGLVFQLSVDVPQKKGPRSVAVLAGGRYDSFLIQERHSQDLVPPNPLCLAGCSISLTVIAQIRKMTGKDRKTKCTAVVCSYSSELLPEKFKLARMLWSVHVSTDILHEPIESFDHLIEYCSQQNIPHLLIVFGRDEVLLRSDGCDHGKMEFERARNQLCVGVEDDLPPTPISMASKSSTHLPASFANCNINFALPERLAFNHKKRVENQIRTMLPDVVSLFSSKCRIEIVVTEITTDLVKTISCSLTKNSTKEELKLLFDSLCRQHGKLKQDLESLYMTLVNIFSPRNTVSPVVLLFRHQDNFYRVIL